MKAENGERLSHSLKEKRKIWPKWLQVEGIEEVVHVRNNSPEPIKAQELEASDNFLKWGEVEWGGAENSESSSLHPFSM